MQLAPPTQLESPEQAGSLNEELVSLRSSLLVVQV